MKSADSRIEEVAEVNHDISVGTLLRQSLLHPIQNIQIANSINVYAALADDNMRLIFEKTLRHAMTAVHGAGALLGPTFAVGGIYELIDLMPPGLVSELRTGTIHVAVVLGIVGTLLEISKIIGNIRNKGQHH